eukprot:SAG31_NODE_450_length_15512_cov_5.788555_14_plen_42_part_00
MPTRTRQQVGCLGDTQEWTYKLSSIEARALVAITNEMDEIA